MLSPLEAGPSDRNRHVLHESGVCGIAAAMDLDTLLYHYFGTTDPATLSDDAVASGLQRVGVAFGTERDAGRRFALWTLLHALDAAPDPAAAFEDRRERAAAELYARAAAQATRTD